MQQTKCHTRTKQHVINVSPLYPESVKDRHSNLYKNIIIISTFINPFCFLFKLLAVRDTFTYYVGLSGSSFILSQTCLCPFSIKTILTVPVHKLKLNFYSLSCHSSVSNNIVHYIKWNNISVLNEHN